MNIFLAFGRWMLILAWLLTAYTMFGADAYLYKTTGLTVFGFGFEQGQQATLKALTVILKVLPALVPVTIVFLLFETLLIRQKSVSER